MLPAGDNLFGLHELAIAKTIHIISPIRKFAFKIARSNSRFRAHSIQSKKISVQ